MPKQDPMTLLYRVRSGEHVQHHRVRSRSSIERIVSFVCNTLHY